MSLSIPTQIAVPFADTGLKVTIPATSNNVTGRAGYNQGFPAINMTPKVAGGIPPFGTDMNGVLYDAFVAIQYLEAGNGYVYNSTFSTAIGGYRPGALVLRTDGLGYWINTINANAVDPESAGAAAAGWVPGYTNGQTSVTMTNANVTLTPLQYGKPVIVITGLLTANLNLIFPPISAQWSVFNNTTGAFTITCKTAAGTGSVVTQGGGEYYSGNGTNLVPAVVSTQAIGDNSQKPASTAYADRAGAGGASGNCYLTKSGANLLLSPKNGNRLTVNGVNCSVPSAGVSLAPTGLLATTLYYVYAVATAGIITSLEASTTGHSTDATTGVEIKTGDATRTFVGMSYVQVAATWSTVPTLTASWFNRRRKTTTAAFSANRVLNFSGSTSEVHSEIRCPFVTFGDEPPQVSITGAAVVSTSTSFTVGFASLDGVTAGTSFFGTTVQVQASIAVNENNFAATEGFHYSTLFANCANAGNCTFIGGANGQISQQVVING